MLVQTGHTDKVMCVDYSADGNYVVTGGMDNQVKLWEVKTGLLVRSFRGHKGMVYQVKISKDGNYLYSCSYDDFQFIKWDAKTGHVLQRKVFSKMPVNDFCITDNGQTILAQGSDAVFVLNSDLKLLKELPVKDAKSVIVSPERDKFYVASNDYAKPHIIVYSLAGFSKLEEISIPIGVEEVSIAGATLLVSNYNQIHRVDLKSKLSTKIFERDSLPVYSAILLSDEESVIFGLADGTIYSINKEGVKTPLATFHLAGVNAMKQSNDGKYLVTASNDCSSQLIEISTGKCLKSFKSSGDFIYHYQFSKPSGKLAFVSGNPLTGNQIGTWNLLNGRFLFSKDKRPAFEVFTNVAYNDKQSAIVAANVSSEAFWYNFPKNSNYWSFTSGNSRAKCVALTSNGKNAIVGTNDGQLIFWRPERNKRENFTISEDGITSIAISPDETIIAVGTDEGRLYLVDFETKIVKTTIESHSLSTGYQDTTWVMSYGSVVRMNIGPDAVNGLSSTSVMDLAFSSKSDTVITCGGNWINLFSTESAERILQIVQNGAGFVCVDLSSDGKKIVASGADGIVRIYNCQTGKLELELSGHQHEVREVSFSPNTNYVLSGSLDSQLKIWDLRAKKELLSAITAFGGKEFIIYNPEGYYFSSKGASSLVSYRIGQKILPFEQFDLKYNRPDLIMKDLSLFTDEAYDSPINSQLIKSYYKAYTKRLQKMNLEESALTEEYHVPEVILLTEKLPISTKDSIIQLSVRSSDSKYELTSLHVLINDVPVYGLNGIQLKTKEANTNLELLLNYGMNNIKIYSLNKLGSKSLVESFEITYHADKEVSRKYYIGIGVNTYLDTTFNLKYSSKDVKDLAEMFKAKFPGSSVTTLINEQVSRENILKLKEMLSQTSVNDEVIVLLSGHGLLSEELDFYYATYDVDFSNPVGNGILFSDLESILDGIPARKKILLIDACHSGELDKSEVAGNSVVTQNVAARDFAAKGQKMVMGLGNSFELMKELFSDLQRGSGTTIIASSSGKYFSFEYDELQNGVFTYSLKEALDGKADRNSDGQITVNELNSYLTSRVTELTRGKQEPTSRQINNEMNFNVW